MADEVERYDLVLGIQSETSGLQEYLAKLEVLPQALSRISREIGNVDLGDARKFSGQGAGLARAYVQAFRAEMAGGQFNAALESALKGVNLKLPESATATLKSDIAKITEQLRKELPQTIRLGVRVNTDVNKIADQTYQTSAQARPSSVEPTSSASAASRRPIPQAPSNSTGDVDWVSSANAEKSPELKRQRELWLKQETARAQARMARDREESERLSAREALTPLGERGARTSSMGVAKEAGVVDKDRPEYQAAAKRLGEATGYGVNPVIRAAITEEERNRASDKFGGVEQYQLLLAQAAESKRMKTAEMQASSEVVEAEKLLADIDRAYVQATKERMAQERAHSQALNETDRIGKAHDRALTEESKRAALRDPNSQESLLQRARETRLSNAATMQSLYEKNPEYSKIIQLNEQARLRQMGATARSEELRSNGDMFSQIRAGAVGFGGMSQTERFSRIFTGAATYNVSSQVLMGVMSALQEVVQGTAQFRESLANLSLTMKDSTENLTQYATEVGSIANAYGLTQAQGVEVAARSVGLFNTGNQSKQNQQDFGKTATKVTGQVATMAGTEDLVSVESSLSGILRSFQMGNEDITRVHDSLASISKASGANVADLLQAGAETATLAKAAGFSLSQSTAIIANQSTQTGQSAQTSGELLAQVFAQATNSAVQTRFRELGVNTDGQTLQNEIAQLSDKLQSGQISSRNLADLSDAFGRSRGGAALINMVENYGRINQMATNADNNPGEGERQFQQWSQNIGSQVKQLVGAFRGVATELTQTGLLDIIGGLVVSLKGLAGALDSVLQVFNLLPGWLRSASINGLLLVKSLQLLAGSKSAGFVGDLLRFSGTTAKEKLTDAFGEVAARSVRHPFTRSDIADVKLAESRTAAAEAQAAQTTAQAESSAAVVAAQEELAAATTAAAAATGAEAAASGVASGAAAAEGAAGAAVGGSTAAGGALMAMLSNPVGWVVAAVAAAGAAGILTYQESNAGVEASKAKDNADTLSATAAKASDLRNAASAQRQAAAAEKAKGDVMMGFFGWVDRNTVNNFGNAANKDNSAAAALDQRAAVVEAADAAAKSAAGGFGRFVSAQDLTTELQTLTAEGYTAAQQLDMLSSALKRVSTAAYSKGVATVLSGENQDFTQALGAAVTGSIEVGRQQAADKATAIDPTWQNNWFTRSMFPDGSAQPYEKAYKNLTGLDNGKIQSEVSSLVASTLTSRGKDMSKGDVSLTSDDLAAVKAALKTKLAATVDPLLKNVDPAIRSLIIDNLSTEVNAALKDYKPQGMTSSQILNAVQAQAGLIDQNFQSNSYKDVAGASSTKVKQLKAAIDNAKGLISKLSKTPDKTGVSDYDKGLTSLQTLDEELAQAEFDDAKNQQTRIQALFKLRESRLGTQNVAGRTNLEIQALRSAVAAAQDPTDKANAQAALNEALDQQAVKNLDIKKSASLAHIDPRNSVGQAKAVLADARRRLSLARASGDAQSVDDALANLHQARQQEIQAAIGVKEAKTTYAAGIGDNVATAKAALANEKTVLSSTLAGTADYYAALSQIQALRKQVMDAFLARAKTQGMLSIDTTDPVAQARQDLLAAKRALQAAQGADEKNQAKLDVKNAQNSLEAAAFSQRLSDVQTLDSLGKISTQAYVKYLESEHNRLSAIAKRTRQETDELNQIDGLIKAASDSISGQFNIGNIDLPTIYQVRSIMQQKLATPLGMEQFRTASIQPVVNNTTNDHSSRSVTINGVSIEQVIKVVKQMVGQSANRTAATGRR